MQPDRQRKPVGLFFYHRENCAILHDFLRKIRIPLDMTDFLCYTIVEL